MCPHFFLSRASFDRANEAAKSIRYTHMQPTQIEEWANQANILGTLTHKGQWMQVELSNITASKKKQDLLTCVVSRFAVLPLEGKEPAAKRG